MTLQHTQKILFLIATFLFVTGIYQKPVHAHRLNVFCYVEGSKVLVESYFQSGAFCENCKIQVQTNGVQVFEGQTNTKGQYSFGFKQDTTYKVTVDAGLGHRGETVFKTDKVLHKVSSKKSGQKSATKKVVTNKTQHVHAESTATQDEHDKQCLSDNAIKELVNVQVEQKIQKLKNDILRDQNKKGVKASDVIAGLGFIFGLCAIILVTFKKKG